MIIRKFLDPNTPSLPQQVAENTDKLEKMSKIYKTTQNLTSSTTTINLNTTNIVDLDNSIIDTFLFSRNGLLFKIKSYTNETLYIEFYSDLSSTNEVITNFEFNPDVVVYENGNARIVGTIKYNQDSLLEPVEAPAEINLPMIAGEGMVVDANEENDKIEIHIDNETISNPNLLVNGDFRVNQRGFDGTNLVRLKPTYCFDRWRYYQWGNSVEITKNDDGSISIYNTTTDTSQGTGVLYFSQPLEHFINRVCDNETYTISCKYKIEYPDSSKQGDCYFYFEQTGATTSGTVTGKLPKTTTPVIDTRTFGLNGTTTKGSVNFNLRQGAKLTIYWVKLELGSIATAFTPRPYAEELALCQRYDNKVKGLGSANVWGFGILQGTTNARFVIPLTTTLRTLPTINTNEVEILNFRTGAIFTENLTFTVLSLMNNAIFLQVESTVSLGTIGDNVQLLGITANGYIDIDAEIY